MNRTYFILKKAFVYICALFVIITINFFLIRFMPGDPLVHYLGEREYYELMQNEPEELEIIRAKYGLEKSAVEQYVEYLKTIVRFDFGYSYLNKQPILEIVGYRLYWTLLLSVPAVILSAIFGALLGIQAGYRRGHLVDALLTPIMIMLNSTPTYCLAILLVVFIANFPGLLPLSGMTSGGLGGMAKVLDIIRHALLPCLTIVLFRTANNYLFIRQTIENIKQENYIITATTKGLRERTIIIRHVLKNALLPYITMICMQFGYVIAGTMMIEVMFSWKGMGALIYNAVLSKDYPVLQVALLVVAASVIFFNIICDIACVIIDPRLSEGNVHE